jgi:hypothetical protein
LTQTIDHTTPAVQPVVSPNTPNVNVAAAGVGVQTAAAQAQQLRTAFNGSTPQQEANSISDSAKDYVSRVSALSSVDPNAVQKVVLVGRTGTGTIGLSGDAFGHTDTVSSLNDSKTGTSLFSSVIFNATPDMSEAGTVILVDIGDIRAAASIVFYMGSPSRAFSINAKFISRTAQEATANNTYLNTLKAWRMPVLGKGEGLGGAEPETLRLFAYGNVIRGIPVMIQSLNVEYSSEIDYINTKDINGVAIWVPIIQNVSIVLKEVRSSDDLGSFIYADYKKGNLTQW